jgi:hypothetical protein
LSTPSDRTGRGLADAESSPIPGPDRIDLLLALGLGALAFVLFRATSQVLLFHDAVYFRGAIAKGKWLYLHVLVLPVLQVVRATLAALGIEARPESVLYSVSAASGGVVVAVTYGTCRLFAPRGISFLQALLVLVTPATWFQSASACIHAFHGALVAIALFAVLRLDARSGFGDRLGAGASLALVPMGHASGVFLLPALLAFARLRGGMLVRRPPALASALILPPLLGLAVVAWIGNPSKVGHAMPSLRLVGHLPGLLPDFAAYLRAGIEQIARSMPALLGPALLGWILARGAPRGLGFASALAIGPLLLGSIWWGVQDRKAAYYLGLVGVLSLGGLGFWRWLGARGGRSLPLLVLASLVAGQAAFSLPDRWREADDEAHRARAETLLSTGALLLYEPDSPLATYLLEAARGRSALNLFIVDVLMSESDFDAGLARLREESEAIRGRDVVLDRRIYEAARRPGSRIAEWFEEFRAGYVAEPLPEEPGFERLRPRG